jgi:hypothetical protein
MSPFLAYLLRYIYWREGLKDSRTVKRYFFLIFPPFYSSVFHIFLPTYVLQNVIFKKFNKILQEWGWENKGEWQRGEFKHNIFNKW